MAVFNDAEIPVLDYGYVKLIETLGTDASIIEAARMSTSGTARGWGGVDPCPQCEKDELLDAEDGLYRDDGCALLGAGCNTCKGSGKQPGDEALLRYLWKHKHATPFEFCDLVIEVQAPIFVFREWHRHRTQSYNEMSGRYTALPKLNYLPSLDRMKASKQSATNKQSSDAAATFTDSHAKDLQTFLLKSYDATRSQYEILLADGVAKEVARLVLPVSQYSRMRAKANLRNWLGFLTLRNDPAAQYEIQQYAIVVESLIQQHFPRTWTLFNESRTR